MQNRVMVYSRDIFETKFSQDPFHGEEGRRFRRIVLENRKREPEMECLKEFLGREPNSNALAKALAKSKVGRNELSVFERIQKIANLCLGYFNK
jgi:hypothetical protein